MKEMLLGLPIVLICCLANTSAAHAHKVTIFAWIEGETVHTESKFSGGKRVQRGKVEVFDSSGTLMLDGRTDSEGVFSFKAPRIVDMDIVLTAGMGHRNSWRLSADEIGKGEPAPAIAPQGQLESPAPNLGRDGPSTPPVPVMSAEQFEQILSRQLERKLQPLTRMVATSQNREPTISDIIGGIGYILGLVGLGTYIRYRKNGRAS